MKKMKWMIGFVLMAGVAFGQQDHDDAGCDCPSCLVKKEGTFTLPGLKELSQQQEAHAECDHDEGAHKKGQAGKPAPQVEQAFQPAQHDDHAGHDHGSGPASGGGDEEEGGVNISPEIAAKLEMNISIAAGGVIAKSMTFPAEIYLNRDRASAVSPRYASVIRQVFAEIGDRVKKGDILASLENCESLAVYTVSAPLSGMIVAKDASVGESASEDRVLFEVADLSTVWADITIFPKYQHVVKKGMPVEFVAHDGHAAGGTIQYVSPLVSHETRTFTARCVLKGASEDFTPGAFVRAQIITESADVLVRIERNAVQTVKGSTVVFILDEHGFESRDVVVGMADEQFVEIKQGLAVGESYVSAGSFALKAEMVTKGMDPHAGHGR